MIENEGAHFRIRTQTKFNLTWPAFACRWRWLVYIPQFGSSLGSPNLPASLQFPLRQCVQEDMLNFLHI